MSNVRLGRATHFSLLLVALIVASCLLPCYVGAQDVGDLIRQGKDLLTRKDFRRAEEAFSAAIKSDPSSAEAYRLRGEARFSQSDYRAAAQDYSRAIEINPRLTSALGARAVANYFLKDYPGSVKDATRAIELAPGDVDLYWTRGTALLEMGDFAGSAADLDQIIRLQPTAQAYFNRGFVREKLGDVPGAVSDFRKMLELDPRHRDAAEASSRLRALAPGNAAARTPTAKTAVAPRQGPTDATWYVHPGGGFRLPLPRDATPYTRGAGDDVDAIAWPDLRLAFFCRRDSMEGDRTKEFLRDAYPGAPGRHASMLTSPASMAVVARYAEDEAYMYWHVCLTRKGRSYFITVAMPAQAANAALPGDALRLLELLEFTR
jgi:tetratricopeptide (TPR) repeat protein